MSQITPDITECMGSFSRYAEISSKNNRSMLPSKKEGYGANSKSGLNKHYEAKFKELSPEQLKKVKSKIRREMKTNRRNRQLIFLGLVLFTTVFILIAGFTV